MFDTPPLQRHLLHKTRDIDQIHAAVAETLCPHKVKVSESGAQAADAVIHSAALPNCAIIYLVYGTEIRVDVSQLGFFLLEIPLSGEATTCVGSDQVASGPGRAVVCGPYQQFAAEWSADCSKLLIKLENNALESYLSTLLGRRQIRALDFEMELDLSSEQASSLVSTIQWIIDDLENPGSLLNTAPIAGIQYQQMLMWTLLHCQPNNYSKELADRQLPQVPHYIRQTEQFIQQHFAEPITLEQLVEQANVSERSLLEGFKRYRDVSPMRYLKLTRLDFVHLALKEANPANNNVTEVALSNGFSQLGKFSTEYKERFGESPSETLKT